jgi:hypothetical protein
MIPSSLEWFADLCANYAHAPQEATLLGKELIKQFNSPNERVQVNRVFRRNWHALAAIKYWLDGDALFAAVNNKSCSITTSAHESAKLALSLMLKDMAPSTVWGMGAQRGVNTGFSTTLEAAALVGYLTKLRVDFLLPEVLYSDKEHIMEGEYLLIAYANNQRDFYKKPLYDSNTALTIASTLFRVNADNIRKFSGPSPASDKSEAAAALFGLINFGLLKSADRYFDVEDLVTAVFTDSNPVTI